MFAWWLLEFSHQRGLTRSDLARQDERNPEEPTEDTWAGRPGQAPVL